jgi:hypothetical protein
MRRRTISVAVSVLLVVVAIAVAFELRRRAAPEPARLLPEADAYLYFNLKPLRQLGVLGKNLPAAQEPEYEEFVRETGFQFERDLDEAAFAIHAPPRLTDAEPTPGGLAPFPRYSEVFRGHFDYQRASEYFHKVAKAIESYRQVEIYSVPLEGRTVRVALLGVGVAAVSNTDGPQATRYMIDRYKELALPFGGPSLVRGYYRQVPFGSLLWAVTRVGSTNSKEAPLMLPGGINLFFPADTTIVASVRYTTAIQVKAEAFAASAEQAKQIVDQVNAFLTIFHGLEQNMNPSGADPDVKAFFGSLQVQEYKTRAVLSASVPPAFLKKVFAEPPTQQITGAPPEPPPKPKRKFTLRHRGR